MTTPIWTATYHRLYQERKEALDPNVRRLVTDKERIVLEAPYGNPLMKHHLHDLRKYKGGKLRILYALSTECPTLWGASPPGDRELMFVYVTLRGDDTYTEAYKELRKEGLIKSS